MSKPAKPAWFIENFCEVISTTRLFAIPIKIPDYKTLFFCCVEYGSYIVFNLILDYLQIKFNFTVENFWFLTNLPELYNTCSAGRTCANSCSETLDLTRLIDSIQSDSSSQKYTKLLDRRKRKARHIRQIRKLKVSTKQRKERLYSKPSGDMLTDDSD